MSIYIWVNEPKFKAPFLGKKKKLLSMYLCCLC